MSRRFASNKRALGICDICGFTYKLRELKDLIVKGRDANLKACYECWDPDHPQNDLGKYPVDDPQALRDPRPDNGELAAVRSQLVPSGFVNTRTSVHPVAVDDGIVLEEDFSSFSNTAQLYADPRYSELGTTGIVTLQGGALFFDTGIFVCRFQIYVTTSQTGVQHTFSMTATGGGGSCSVRIGSFSNGTDYADEGSFTVNGSPQTLDFTPSSSDIYVVISESGADMTVTEFSIVY